MACQVTPDPTGNNDFLAPTGANVTICFNTDSGNYRLTAATYAGNALALAGNCVSFTVAAGVNLLNTTAVDPDTTETVHLTENCGDGTNRGLGDFPFKPIDGFTVVGS